MPSSFGLYQRVICRVPLPTDFRTAIHTSVVSDLLSTNSELYKQKKIMIQTEQYYPYRVLDIMIVLALS